jgi:hypothetical protein
MTHYARYAREGGVEVTEIAGTSRLFSPLRDPRSFLAFLRIFCRERPIIVHTHTASQGRWDGWQGWPPVSR